MLMQYLGSWPSLLAADAHWHVAFNAKGRRVMEAKTNKRGKLLAYNTTGIYQYANTRFFIITALFIFQK